MPKKTYKRKRGYKKYQLSQPVPNTMTTTLVYEANYATTLSSIVNLSHYTFRLSSVYDPDFTAVGHQPLGFDQWANFYERYIVKGAKIYITAQDTNSIQNSAVALTATINEDTQPSTQIQAVREQPNSKTMILGQRHAGPSTMVVKYSPRKLFGYMDTADADDLISTTNNNPVKNAFLHISLEELEPNPSTRNGNVIVRTRIEYLVQFRGNQELPRS